MHRLGRLMLPCVPAVAGRAVAQVPLSPTEVAQYRGLHAAAHRRDVAAVQRLARERGYAAMANELGDVGGR